MTNGEYRLPALPPGNYTVKFELAGHAGRHPRSAGAAVAGHRRRRDARRRGRLRERDRHRGCGVSSSGTRRRSPAAISNQQIQALPVGQEYRDLIKLIPGVQVTQDTIRGPSAGRQRPGQRLPVRRRQRHAAAVRHAVGRTRLARHRAGDDDQGRRQGSRLRPRRRFRDRLGQQVGHRQVHRADQLPAAERGHVGGLTSGASSRYEQDRGWIVANAGGPIVPDHLYFFGSYYRPENAREQPRQPVRRAAGLSEHAERRLRQAHVHADALDPDQRQLP